MKDVEVTNVESKNCRDCGKLLPMTDFYAERRNGRTLYKPNCRKCSYAAGRARILANRDRKNGPVKTIKPPPFYTGFEIKTNIDHVVERPPKPIKKRSTEEVIALARAVVETSEKMQTMEGDLEAARMLLSDLEAQYKALTEERDSAIRDMTE